MRLFLAAAVLATAAAMPATAEYQSTCSAGDSEVFWVHDEGGSGERLYVDHPTVDREALCIEIVNEDPTLGVAVVLRGGTGVEITPVEYFDCPITAMNPSPPLYVRIGFGGPICVDIGDDSYHVSWTTTSPVVEVWRVHGYGGPRERIV